jgi:hypothetical protein
MIEGGRRVGQKYHIVVLPETEYPRLETFETVPEMIQRIQVLLGDEVSLFPFVGNFMPITKGPHRFLLTPYGPLPLFHIPTPEELEMEATGYVGPTPTEFAIPIPRDAPVPIPQPVSVDPPQSGPAAPQTASESGKDADPDGTQVLPQVDES